MRHRDRPGRVRRDAHLDALGHLLTQTHKRPDGSTSYQVEYTLAPDGNRLRAVETRDDDVVTWDYEYDRLGRLQREKRGEGESPSSWHRDISYTYDADSNRATKTDNNNAANTETYTYTNGRLARVDRGDATYTVYDWTANGEQSRVTEYADDDNPTERQEFAWGGAGDRTLEAVRVYESDGSGTLALEGRVEYDYDHSGEKIARRVYSAGDALLSHRKYLVDHQNPTGYSQTLAELEIVDPATGDPSESSDAVARIARLNTFDPLGPVAQTDFARGDWIQNQQSDSVSCPPLSVTRRHLFADPLGSIRTLTSQTDSGTIESAEENYTAFGAPLNGSLTPGEPHAATPQYAFTAQTRDPYSGLQYHRARWLNTGIGQWVSSDPVFDFPGNFGSRRGYAGQLPCLATDPSGEGILVETAVAASVIAMTWAFAFGSVKLVLTRVFGTEERNDRVPIQEDILNLVVEVVAAGLGAFLGVLLAAVPMVSVFGVKLGNAIVSGLVTVMVVCGVEYGRLVLDKIFHGASGGGSDRGQWELSWWDVLAAFFLGLMVGLLVPPSYNNSKVVDRFFEQGRRGMAPPRRVLDRMGVFAIVKKMWLYRPLVREGIGSAEINQMAHYVATEAWASAFSATLLKEFAGFIRWLTDGVSFVIDRLEEA